MSSFSHSNQLLNEQQLAFCQGISSEYQLLANVQKWQMETEEGKFGAVVFMDLSKALDYVNRRTLRKNFANPFSGTVLLLLRNYLTFYAQKAAFSGQLSEIISVQKGTS